MESLRTSLALKTHFEVLDRGLESQVLGLGLEASSPRKLLCPQLEDSSIFWIVKILLENARNLAKNLRRPFLFSSFENRLKKILKIFFLENTCACVLGPWPWPWPRAFMSLASRGSVLGRAVLGLGFFFASLSLAPSFVSSSPLYSLYYAETRVCRSMSASLGLANTGVIEEILQLKVNVY